MTKPWRSVSVLLPCILVACAPDPGLADRGAVDASFDTAGFLTRDEVALVGRWEARTRTDTELRIVVLDLRADRTSTALVERETTCAGPLYSRTVVTRRWHVDDGRIVFDAPSLPSDCVTQPAYTCPPDESAPCTAFGGESLWYTNGRPDTLFLSGSASGYENGLYTRR